MSKRKTVLQLVSACLVLGALPAQAYVGPGMGAGGLGVVLGLLGSILLALFAVFWYPIKRALFGGQAKVEDDEEIEGVEPAEQDEKQGA